jgi:predicted metallopeptidase
MVESKDVLDYPLAIKELSRDICNTIAELRHIDVERVGFGMAEARNRHSQYGQLAYITPLLFEGGVEAVAIKRVVTRPLSMKLGKGTARLEVTRYFKNPVAFAPDGKTRFMYLFTVMTPRFCNLGFDDKLTTIFHELYHIDPSFNGFVRRFPGRNWQHGSKTRYEAVCRDMCDRWLKKDPNPKLFSFLQWNYNQIFEHYASIRGRRFSKTQPFEISREEAIKLNPALK